MALPYPRGTDHVGGPWASYSRRVHGGGDKKSAVTDPAHIADFLARILPDPRTENQTVFCWEDEVTQNEVWQIAAREADEGAEIIKLQETVSELLAHEAQLMCPQISPEQLEAEIASAKVPYDEQGPSWETILPVAMGQYQLTLYVRGDNTRANAVSAGALDAQELYPDLVPAPFADYAKRWYRSPTPFPYEV
jgi:hypothetical protein